MADIEDVHTDPLSDHVVRQVAEAALRQARLDRLTDQVARLRRGLSDASASNAVLADLETERASLLRNPFGQAPAFDVAQARLDASVLAISDLLFPWQTLQLPNMTEGIDETPGTSDTEGNITTAGLFVGGLGYGGTLSQDGSNGPAERWWIHNWRNLAVFPGAPHAGRLYYRFTVDSECHIYHAPVLDGSVREFVTIGKTADVAATPMNDWTIWQTVGWPIDQPLPTATLNLSGAVPVAGSIPVAAGKSAALGFIYGTIISVAGGYVQLLWGNYGTRRTVAGDAPISYRDYGKVEYRFEPDWWLHAVDSRMYALHTASG